MRDAAAQEFRALAETHGYGPNFAVGRAGYGTFISLKYRFLYMELPKVACTSIKRMLVRLCDARLNLDKRPYQRETRHDMLIHQRRYVEIPCLLDIPKADRDQLLAGSKDWLVFAAVRNPFSRVVSVFENKVRLGEPRFRDLESRYGDRGPFADSKTAFSAFVREVVADPKKRGGDGHFNSQTQMLLDRLIPYTHLFKLERIGELSKALQEHVARAGGPPLPPLTKENSSLGSNWRDYYDAETAEIVARAFAEDFARFQYDPADWRGGRPHIIEDDIIRRWRAEIVERNALIDFLYDFIEPDKPR